MIIAIPVTLIAGPIFNKVAQKMIPSAYTREGDISALGAQKEFTSRDARIWYEFINSNITSHINVSVYDNATCNWA